MRKSLGQEGKPQGLTNVWLSVNTHKVSFSDILYVYRLGPINCLWPFIRSLTSFIASRSALLPIGVRADTIVLHESTSWATSDNAG